MTYSSPDPSDERPVPPPLGTVREAGSIDETDDTAEAGSGPSGDGTLDEQVARPDVAGGAAPDAAVDG